LKFIK